jgi:hypothetical protein
MNIYPKTYNTQPLTKDAAKRKKRSDLVLSLMPKNKDVGRVEFIKKCVLNGLGSYSTITRDIRTLIKKKAIKFNVMESGSNKFHVLYLV